MITKSSTSSRSEELILKRAEVIYHNLRHQLPVFMRPGCTSKVRSRPHHVTKIADALRKSSVYLTNLSTFSSNIELLYFYSTFSSVFEVFLIIFSEFSTKPTSYQSIIIDSSIMLWSLSTNSTSKLSLIRVVISIQTPSIQWTDSIQTTTHNLH